MRMLGILEGATAHHKGIAAVIGTACRMNGHFFGEEDPLSGEKRLIRVAANDYKELFTKHPDVKTLVFDR